MKDSQKKRKRNENDQVNSSLMITSNGVKIKEEGEEEEKKVLLGDCVFCLEVSEFKVKLPCCYHCICKPCISALISYSLMLSSKNTITSNIPFCFHLIQCH